MKCPLCGYSFPEEKIECRECPMGNNCQLVCCPHCHYQFIDPHRSGVLNLLKKLFKQETFMGHRITKDDENLSGETPDL